MESPITFPAFRPRAARSRLRPKFHPHFPVRPRIMPRTSRVDDWRRRCPSLDGVTALNFGAGTLFPADARPVTGYLFSRGQDGDMQAIGEHLGIGGTENDIRAGRLFFYTGNDVGTVTNGSTAVAFRDWHHVVLTRQERELRVFLDGKLEIEADVDWTLPEDVNSMFIGGRCDDFSNFEGKIDEVALYPHTLTAKQAAAHFAAAERRRQVEVGALNPDEALKTIRVPEGYAVDLVAAEPLVLDPVAFDWDTQGRLWVVEMADYPLGLGDGNAAGGRVRMLEDRDRDGTMDHSTLFAEGLNFPKRNPHLARRRHRHGGAGDSFPARLQRRRQGGFDRGPLNRTHRRQPAAAGERIALGTRQLGLCRRRRTSWEVWRRYEDSLLACRCQDARRQPRFPVSARHWSRRAAEWSDTVWPQSRQLGALVWDAEFASAVALHAAGSLPPPQSPLRRPGRACAAARGGQSAGVSRQTSPKTLPQFHAVWPFHVSLWRNDLSRLGAVRP